ncbi:MAG: glycosyltransferase [Erysipelotrichaceae bacterium]|nr:glycosyltransferase [Erysipelotrichaceae bacterium]
MDKTISVAMAVYQGAPFLTKQMESLINQTRLPNEIIIVDDVSDDETFTIAKQYETCTNINVKVLKQTKRVGYIQNFKTALAHTSGDYIFLCDQDDIWEHNKIETMMSLFQKHPEITCINTSAQYIDAFDRAIHCETNTHKGVIDLNEIFYHNISMGCTMAFTKNVCEHYLKKSCFEAPHDWELNLIAALQGTLYYLPIPLVKYRLHEHNTTGNDALQKSNHVFNDTREKNARTMLQFIEGCGAYQQDMHPLQTKQQKQLCRFYEKRFELLHNKKKRNWFYLITHITTYRKIVSTKGMLADLLYAFKSKQAK